MLVLSRRLNDKVVFPHLGITVEILRITGNAVRVGIEAPRDVPVHRKEVFEAIEAANRDAASPEAADRDRFPATSRSKPGGAGRRVGIEPLRAAEARSLLEGVMREKPEHDYGHTMMALAETLTAVGESFLRMLFSPAVAG